MSLYNLIRTILVRLQTKRFGVDINEDEQKVKFEKAILRLLKRFDLYNKQNTAIQKIKIIAGVDDLPRIEVEYIIIDKKWLNRKGGRNGKRKKARKK